MKFGMILNVTLKQVKRNSYIQEAHGFGGAIEALLEEFEGRIHGLPLVGVSFLAIIWERNGY